ncbi:Helix-turn-helix domain-containing protein [Arachidicoccus rhizosphaerae]|uniref:Helix-turn-helix domain-containing protein n=1 Tax=Arachidicoccus rhizosphaerae TaxID=551991 RepID=A0A1H3XHX0_9BACT|nr:AraC family transcriptional regulator [Arachidicoccus rhizosphaerae]SDZ98913.1 Helix-turn-helix domain-containing protein [Arachidicoccus rhizosphaerae]
MAKLVLHIKNMVCPRCVQAVEVLAKQLGWDNAQVDLGTITWKEDTSGSSISPDKAQLAVFSKELQALGFELIDTQKGRLIEQIKKIVISLVRNADGEKPKENLSQILSGKLHYDYNHLSAIFSAAEGQTIEKYYIAQRIEFVKELLVYDELTLNQIAFNLGYSSTAHLSAQFKKVTGLTASHFKQIKDKKRKFLTDL